MSFFSGLHQKAHELSSRFKANMTADTSEENQHSHTHETGICSDGLHSHSRHRYHSFAPQREGNQLQWYVDGCSYMWAVSVALEKARESIWILDWWLSPELYLRRPPSQNEQYRLDHMLLAAAERGVKVKIIVYKEVTQALARKYFSPNAHDILDAVLNEADVDPFTRFLSHAGMFSIVQALELSEENDPLIRPILPVSSAHTKHHLEGLHENIAVFRHPDHLPDTKVMGAHILDSLSSLKLTANSIATLPSKTLAGLYGTSGGTVLYWAHHEKLCLIDGEIAFMGGLDLCYGRWDTHNHPIADNHPGDDRRIIFPGQDYNNARVMDFHDVPHWQVNKYDRAKGPRMGWSDISLSLKGPTVLDLQVHFGERWNFIMSSKYSKKNKSGRYEAVDIEHSMLGVVNELRDEQENPQPTIASPSPEEEERRRGEAGKFEDPNILDPSLRVPGHEDPANYPNYPGEEKHSSRRGSALFRAGAEKIFHHVEEIDHRIGSKVGGHHFPGVRHLARAVHGERLGGAVCQLTRSCAQWSHGVPVEHSIANAYIDHIKNAQHFIYIENQFFITATCAEQKPVANLIGAAIVDRVRRAARNNEQFRMIVVIPAIPAFPGDLRSDEALSTRAIMEFQYDSICRDQKKQMSIFETLERDGIDGREWIKFHNLRSFDRIAKYAGPDNGRWDSVSECVMLNGTNLMDIPWEGSEEEEMDAFVSELLYVHSKVMIIDDRTVICGSANLNDRSQLGDHDSEIAIIINDPVPCPTPAYLAGKPNPGASRFASSLRRTLFRRHLGLLRPQLMDVPNDEYLPVGVGCGSDEIYDWGSREDLMVADPLDPEFERLWDETAKKNTDIFRQVFHPVPDDSVESWTAYEQYYTKYFAEQPPQEGSKEKTPAKYGIGHVVAEDFFNDVRRVKMLLSEVRGTLVEMSLKFLQNEDIAQEGLGLNAVTEEIYT